MGVYRFSGVERYNYLKHGPYLGSSLKEKNIICVVDEKDTITIFTKEEEYNEEKENEVSNNIATS